MRLSDLMAGLESVRTEGRALYGETWDPPVFPEGGDRPMMYASYRDDRVTLNTEAICG